MSHVTVLTSGNGGARFLAGLVDVRPEEEVQVVVGVGADFRAWGLYCCPDIDLVLHTLAGEWDPFDRGENPEETFACRHAMRKLGMPARVAVSDRGLATHLLRTEILGTGATLAATTAQLAERFGVGPVILPITDDPVRTLVRTVSDGTVGLAEFSARRAQLSEPVEILHEGVERARPGDSVLRSILEAERVIVSPADPHTGLGALLEILEIRNALAHTRSGVVAISPIIGSQPARGSGVFGPKRAGDFPIAQFANRMRGIADSLVIHTSDLPQLDAIRSAGVDAWVDNILLNSREDAERLAGRVVFPDRLIAKKR